MGKAKKQTKSQQSLYKMRDWFNRHRVAELMALALILTICVESLARRSIFSTFAFIMREPAFFACNLLLVLTTLSSSLLFSKKNLVLMLWSVVWLGLGLADYVLLGFRITPLSAIDFALLKSAVTMLPIYLNGFEILLAAIAVIAILVALILLALRAKRYSVVWKMGVPIAVFLCVATVLSFDLGIQVAKAEKLFGNLGSANQRCGFPFCFTASVVNRGINKPEKYSGGEIEEIVETLVPDLDVEAPDESLPNILFVQLESFFDVSSLNGVVCSENPTPTFCQMKKDCPSGYLTVPSIGAGTANTEFEVLSGMSLDYFGVGEYPYKTILKQTSCESVCFNLRNLGYTSHAIHNHSGAFYDRNEVFSALGFDTYTSLEYMENVTYNSIGWANDSVLLSQITDVLQSTENRDFLYTITVQAHGKYPTKPLEGIVPEITCSGIENEGTAAAFEYYVNELHEADNFVGGLITLLEQYDEPIVVVLFGDHLPNFDVGPEDVSGGDVFQTEYVIWSNFALTGEDEDLYAYQLAAHVLGMLNIEEGLLMKLHQQQRDSENYQEMLEMLEYDLLYGDRAAYQGENRYEATPLKMGHKQIEISAVRAAGGHIYVSGKHFTPFSVILLDGAAQETEYINANTLITQNRDPRRKWMISVSQIGKNHETLSTTEAYHFQPIVSEETP